MSEDIQKKLEAEVDAFKNVQRGVYNKAIVTPTYIFYFLLLQNIKKQFQHDNNWMDSLKKTRLRRQNWIY